jgi:hypothetical protein
MPQKKRKESHLLRNAFILIVIVVVSAVVINGLNQLSPPTTPTTSSTSSLTGQDFYVAPPEGPVTICGIANATGLKAFLSVSLLLENDKNLQFHFISAHITVVNYTLANGTVITSGEQEMDYSQTFGMAHTLSFPVFFKVPKSGPTVTKTQLSILVHVSEVPELFTIQYTLPASC